MTTTYAKFTLPKRYGTVYVQNEDGTETAHAGGSVALMPSSQAASIGATPHIDPGPPIDEPATDQETPGKEAPSGDGEAPDGALPPTEGEASAGGSPPKSRGRRRKDGEPPDGAPPPT